MTLEERMAGLVKAVGEMEPGGREFCLAAIDEWLDAYADLRADRDGLREWCESRIITDAQGIRDWIGEHDRAESLRAENDRLRALVISTHDHDALRADRERLRAVVERIAENGGWVTFEAGDGGLSTRNDAGDWAREALEDGEG